MTDEQTTGREVATARRQTIIIQDPEPIFDTGSFEHMWRIATAMATARMVPKHFWESPGDCMMVVEQARRWNMSPYAVAQKTYVVDGKLGYEAQLVAAVVNSSPLLQGRLKHRYSGTGLQLQCTVSGLIVGEAEPRDKESPMISSITVKNSPLWRVDPAQQLLYWTQRSWARAHAPDVLLGVYTPDEIQDGVNREIQLIDRPPEPARKTTGQVIKDITPAVEDETQTAEAWSWEFQYSDGEIREFDDPKVAIEEWRKQTASTSDILIIQGFWETNAGFLQNIADNGMAEEATALQELTKARLKALRREAAAAAKKAAPAVAETPAEDGAAVRHKELDPPSQREDAAFWAEASLELDPCPKGSDRPAWKPWAETILRHIGQAGDDAELLRLESDNARHMPRLRISLRELADQVDAAYRARLEAFGGSGVA